MKIQGFAISFRRILSFSALLLLLVNLPVSSYSQTGERLMINRMDVADSLTESLMAKRQAIRAGSDPQALEAAIDPSTYLLGPGDGVFLDVYTAHFLDQDLTVTPEGKMILPRTGQVDVTGVSIAEAEKRVNKLLSRDYKNPQAFLSLRRLRNLKVNVLGEVLYPGVHDATAMMRVSEVISKAGSMTERSSLRNIEVRNPDGSLRTKADLTRYFNTGNLASNPILQGGDVVVVPRSSKTILINGFVSIPGAYEFVEGDKLSTIIALAKGLKPGALLDSVEIARFSPEDPMHAQRTYHNFLSGGDVELMDGDVISIQGNSQYHVPRVVSVGGEVRYPGKYSIELDQTKLSDVLARAGGILPSGSLDEACVLRRAGVGSWESDPEFIMIERMKGFDEKRISNDQYNYYMARMRQLGRQIMTVNFRALVEGKDFSQDIKLRDEDSIWIPRARGYVSVIGSVNNQGNVRFIEGGSYRDYIDKAGGFNSNADRGAVRVINSRSSSYINPRSGDYQIEAGDTIIVPEEHSEFWKNFELATAITSQVLTILAGIFLLSRK